MNRDVIMAVSSYSCNPSSLHLPKKESPRKMSTTIPAPVYCITGGGGYIGSWLVKTLLENGNTMHATLKDLGNPSKNSCLLSLPGAHERLRLFKADMCDEGSFDLAIHGCHNVFHVATPTDFGSQDLENEIIEAAIRGTLNVPRSCKRVESVRRVVFTSSLSAASTADEFALIDESCWTSLNSIKENKRHGWFYTEADTINMSSRNSALSSFHVDSGGAINTESSYYTMSIK